MKSVAIVLQADQHKLRVSETQLHSTEATKALSTAHRHCQDLFTSTPVHAACLKGIDPHRLSAHDHNCDDTPL